MRYVPSRTAALAVIFVTLAVAQSSEISQSHYPRRNQIVEAVEKTKESIVTVKVARPGAVKDTVGTGVIIDRRGYIVTNRHVVGTARNVRVRLYGGTELTAQIVWADAAYDLAVLRVPTDQQLPELRLAPVGDLMVGETVIAVGHPYGYTNTVSTGIISALNREITMPSGDTLTGLIQTNASINPGNSGGPLLNINGELIGINAALRDGAQGIAFAINAGTIERALAQHLSSAKIAGVSHGLSCQDEILGETGDRQRVVVAGYRGAGSDLCQGDVIRAIGDCSIGNAFDVERALWDNQAGDKVNLKVVRQGQEMNVTLVLAGGHGAGRVATGHAPSNRRAVPALNNSVPVANPQH